MTSPDEGLLPEEDHSAAADIPKGGGNDDTAQGDSRSRLPSACGTSYNPSSIERVDEQFELQVEALAKLLAKILRRPS